MRRHQIAQERAERENSPQRDGRTTRLLRRKNYRRPGPGPIGLFLYLVHLSFFAFGGFIFAYLEGPPNMYVLYGGLGIVIAVYIYWFYRDIFGREEVHWMFINAALGLFGIYAQIDWILSWFDKSASDYPLQVHVIPFMFYVLYTFLLYHFVTSFGGPGEKQGNSRAGQVKYVVWSIVIYTAIYLLTRT